MNTIYKYITIFLTPLIKVLAARRLKSGKEHKQRHLERYGVPSIPRPKGNLVWFHGASVGEAQSILVLIDRLTATHPDLSILVTTGTLTSANLMEKRLPQNAFHQFLPYDQHNWVERFLNAWQPNLVFWVESEIWPNLLNGIKKRKIPAVLLNARMSEKSFLNWKRCHSWIKDILSVFQLCLAQSSTDARYLEKLGALKVVDAGNLKFAAKPLPYDHKKMDTLKTLVGGRKTLLFASTHAPEEEIAGRVHRELAAKNNIAGLLSIIVPRHPERGADIKLALSETGLNVAQASQHEEITDKTDIYLADTLGELGQFYRLCNIVFIGNSLTDTPGGGHNPIEAAQLDCAIIYGPHMFNFDLIHREMQAAQASLYVKNMGELISQAHELLTNDQKAATLSLKAQRYAQEKADCLENVWQQISPMIEKLNRED